jgi:hypothetical protein
MGRKAGQQLQEEGVTFQQDTVMRVQAIAAATQMLKHVGSCAAYNRQHAMQALAAAAMPMKQQAQARAKP